MSDVSGDSYLYAVAAAAASVVLTVLLNVGGRKGAHGCDRCYVVGRRLGACDFLLTEQRATDYCMLKVISQECRQLNSIFCCVQSESKNGSSRWRRPIPPHTKLAVKLTLHEQVYGAINWRKLTSSCITLRYLTTGT